MNMITRQDSAPNTEEKTCEQSHQLDGFADGDDQDESLDQFAGFLDNIGKMLDDEPLDEEAQKKSRKIALRTKLRGYKKKTEAGKALNVKKLVSGSKRRRAKLQSQIYLKNNSQVQDPDRQRLVFADVTNKGQQKYSSSILMTKPSEFSLDSNSYCQNGSYRYQRENGLSLDQFEMQFDHNSFNKNGSVILQQPTEQQSYQNCNLAQDASTCFNSQYLGSGLLQIPISYQSRYNTQSNPTQAKQHDVFPYQRSMGLIQTEISDSNDLDNAFVNRFKTQTGQPTSIFEIADKQLQSPPKTKVHQLHDDDAKTSVSMRVDDEPTMTTHKHSGDSRKYKHPHNMVDVLDTDDMSFDLIAQNQSTTIKQ